MVIRRKKRARYICITSVTIFFKPKLVEKATGKRFTPYIIQGHDSFADKDDPSFSIKGYTGLNSLSPLALTFAA